MSLGIIKPFGFQYHTMLIYTWCAFSPIYAFVSMVLHIMIEKSSTMFFWLFVIDGMLRYAMDHAKRASIQGILYLMGFLIYL